MCDRLSDTVCSFLAYCQKSGMSERTIDDAADVFYAVERSIGVEVADLTVANIVAFLKMDVRGGGSKNTIQKGKPRSPRTNQKYFNKLRSFYTWMALEGLPTDPDVLDFFVKQSYSADRTPDDICYTPEEVERIFEAAASDFHVSYSARNVLILAFAYYLCLRTSSITGIKLFDIEWDAARVNVTVKRGKKSCWRRHWDAPPWPRQHRRHVVGPRPHALADLRPAREARRPARSARCGPRRTGSSAPT